MGTVTVRVCYFPSCTTALPCRNCNNLSLTHHHQLLQHTSSASTSLPLTQFHLRASQTSTIRNTTRKSRRLKSDAEICSDIRQFLASVGLPENHIPSTKELLQHGRNDLANIVRRRGHKKIQELLTTSSLNAELDSLHTENGLYERPDAANDHGDLLTGQNEKADSLVDDVTESTDFFPGNSSSSLSVDSSLSLDECNSFSVESSARSSIENGLGELKDHTEVASNAIEGNFYRTEVITVDNDCNSSTEGFDPDYYSQSSMPTEVSGELSFETTSSGSSECEDSLVDNMVGEITLPSAVPSLKNHSNMSLDESDLDTGDREFSQLEQKDWHGSEGLDDGSHNVAEGVPTTSTTSEVSSGENLSGGNEIDSVVHSTDSSCINVDSSANLSLEERVANFIQNGDLEPVEDHVSGISNGDASQESKEYIESEPVVDAPLGVHPSYDYNVNAPNRNSLISEEDATLDQPLPDDHLPREDLTTHFDEDLDTEAPKVQNQSEMNHLKFMLYQKELELSRLKEQIEKEKLALSVLQTKAEAEISKARKLISEKDAELHIAEESLSGLKEVQVDFYADADADVDVVEVAGSFNGWHHRIKMEPQLSTSATDASGSRRSKYWSTMLWLYPGVYEIKFVVDGHWRTDPQRESVTRGHLCNNILRVDR